MSSSIPAVFPADGSPAIGATGGTSLVGNVIDTTLDSYLFDTGEPAGVAASIHMTVTETGEKFDRLFRSRDQPAGRPRAPCSTSKAP